MSSKGGHILPTGTVTLLFTDIEGSTPLWEQMPAEMQQAVAQHHAILQKVIEANHGQVFQILGDAFQAAFSLAIDGVSAAIQAQKELQSAAWGSTGPLRVRMGLHTGPLELSVIPNQAGVREYAVCHTLNRAARVMSAGYGGQILVSDVTKALVERELPEWASLRDLGEHQLKGMCKLEHLYQVVAAGLPTEFPALPTGVAQLHNLPAELTSFIGRERELAELKQLLLSPGTRLVTVTGPGGIGKTRLSLKVAEQMVDTYGDGVWFIELVSLSDPGLVSQAVAQVLRVREVPGLPLLQTLSEHLHNKQILLILDNCEHLSEAVADFAGDILRACPRVQIMSTSREILRLQGEVVYPCPPLLPADQKITSAQSSADRYVELASNAAIRLFAERAASSNPLFRLTPKNSVSIDSICRQLDGIPLAIELAAARVRLLSVEQISRRLGDAFQLLTEGSKSKVPHHQTLKALIDWSYNLLASPEKTMLLRLSVFSGGWDLEAAEAIVSGEEIEQNQVMDLMTRLIDKSLITLEASEFGDNRYRMLETIRQYASEKLIDLDWHLLLRKRHLKYYTDLTEAAAPQLWEKDQAMWIQRLTIENDNIRSALHWSLKRQDVSDEEVELGVRMATSLWYYWYLFGVVKESCDWLTIALDSYPRADQRRARLLCADGTFAWQLGDLPKASERLRESLELFHKLEDKPGLAEATHLYGHIIIEQQNFTEAERLFKESLAIYESLNNTGIRIALIGDLGVIACYQGDLDRAQKYYQQCLSLSIQNNLRDNEAQSYLRLGDIYRLEGDYDTADRHYQKSLAINRELNISREIACLLHRLGYIAVHRGDPDQAQALFLESLAIQGEVSNQQGMAECLGGLASVKVMRHEDESAAMLFGAASEILNRTGLPLGPADLAEWQRDEMVARQRCDPQRFQQAWSTGVANSVEGMVAGLLAPGTSS
jgi:predicted ATPase/class 3 adenylate cyclase/Flp pilus assembly protein TadD